MRFSGPETIIKAIEYVAAATLTVATLNVFLGGLLRYTLNIGIPDSNDFGKMLLGIVAFYGIAAIGLRGGHIVVSALADCLPGLWGRLVVLFADVVTCGAMGILCWMLFTKGLATRSENLISYDLGVSLWGFYIAGAIGLGLGTAVYALMIVTGKHLATAPVGATPENEGVNL